MKHITTNQPEMQGDLLLKGLIASQEQLIAIKDHRINVLNLTIDLLQQKLKAQECQVCGSEKNTWYRISVKKFVCNTCWNKVADSYKENV